MQPPQSPFPHLPPCGPCIMEWVPTWHGSFWKRPLRSWTTFQHQPGLGSGVWARPIDRELGGTSSLWSCPGGAVHSGILTLPGKWAGEGPGVAAWQGARSPSSWNRICLCLRRGCGAMGLQTEAAHFPRASPSHMQMPPSSPKGRSSSFSPDLLRNVTVACCCGGTGSGGVQLGWPRRGWPPSPPGGPLSRDSEGLACTTSSAISWV